MRPDHKKLVDEILAENPMLYLGVGIDRKYFYMIAALAIENILDAFAEDDSEAPEIDRDAIVPVFTGMTLLALYAAHDGLAFGLSALEKVEYYKLRISRNDDRIINADDTELPALEAFAEKLQTHLLHAEINLLCGNN